MSGLEMPLKAPVRCDLVQPLAKWLDGDMQNSFEPTNPLQLVVPKPDFKSSACLSDLKRLAALRNCLSESLLDSHKSAIEEHNALRDCHDYHATLLEFEKRGFPTLDDKFNGINLTWKGAFATQQQETHHSLVWDRACTMWNIAALEWYMAGTTDLTTKDGCKTAIARCQSAASTLAVLRDLASSDDYMTVDVAPCMISFWEKVVLAQGQFCIYKMANLGDTVRQHSVLGYLMKATFDLYNEALQAAQDPRLLSEVPKQAEKWGAHCKAKSMIACAKAEFHQAIDYRMSKQHGNEIYRLRICVTMINEAAQFVGSAGLTMPEVDALKRLAKDRLATSEKDNYSVYKDMIPDELEDIRSQQLVKSNLGLTPEMLQPKVKLFQNV
mmetsp:Transcript_25295/g.70859  ORF Transcript_25295/g.70859 Transcript_25295/m.70859 type:complete len:383 (+) Transcript_25295:185-1333(+)|eukprot:CAMPEP_0119545784 /NCGR_PEP_ID=MMETSP1352-20130426/435_1 /TAXON_ID=265584 /ORGANISM="Stauroneis constricta, Strain CCMP1120" /LENGTH=382 /DNA_ID=CAMNT_0007590385 /DNA_START=185 /DNA_END=1333 /DNA_ORIENTATION=+